MQVNTCCIICEVLEEEEKEENYYRVKKASEDRKKRTECGTGQDVLAVPSHISATYWSLSLLLVKYLLAMYLLCNS